MRTDHIGRPVFATDDTGAVQWTASYLPFGGVETSTGNPIELRFPGQWFQSESGLHQNWMREYDPTTGRYLQADPLGLVDGPSVYGYALQNPGRYVDPRGEGIVALPWLWGIITGGSTATTGAGTGLGIALGIGVAVTPSTPGDGTLGEDAKNNVVEGEMCEDPCRQQKENLARAKKNNPGKCLPGDSKATLMFKYARTRDLLKARMEAFQCFADGDPNHKDEIQKVRKTLRECARRLGRQ